MNYTDSSNTSDSYFPKKMKYIPARSKHKIWLLQILIDFIYRLFGRCNHEYHVRYYGGRWRDPTCIKCGKKYAGLHR